jgi:hypothetical protein
MKKALSILLLVITIVYIMPINYSAFNKDSISLNTAEKNCDETSEIKKDNKKEVFNNSNEQFPVAFTKSTSYYMHPLLLSSFSGFVETPPPDFL